ncbi:hypothetical protein L596_010275 [Steinernema carpocapsae]|uniref:Uncharacterized protein n=1 Tax=Steinernema carpocapsae TaxID=34508 RepID=A0A4U5PID9_STECR|nr:hypothetical protein L596_010275 [Steinernema carpocapsae]
MSRISSLNSSFGLSAHGHTWDSPVVTELTREERDVKWIRLKSISKDPFVNKTVGKRKFEFEASMSREERKGSLKWLNCGK